MKHLRGIVLFLLCLAGDASRSVRISDSHQDAQQEINTLASGVEVSVVAQEALIPGAVKLNAVKAAGRISRPMMQMKSWNPLKNLQQMTDQRVAKVSHCLLRAGTNLTLAEATAKIGAWKAEIGNDEAKFIEVVKRDSEASNAAEGGLLGIFSRGKLSTELDELIFKEDVIPLENGGKGGEVRGPIATKFDGQAGLSLLYIHSCWQPMSTSD